MSRDAMQFDLETTVVPVRIGQKDYYLQEATCAAACTYQNYILRNTKLGPDGKAESIQDVAEAEPLLVSLCLFEASTKTPVPLSTVKGWPAKVVEQLAAKAKEISLLTTDAEDKAKN